jgi:hypothetical protein
MRQGHFCNASKGIRERASRIVGRQDSINRLIPSQPLASGVNEQPLEVKLLADVFAAAFNGP